MSEHSSATRRNESTKTTVNTTSHSTSRKRRRLHNQFDQTTTLSSTVDHQDTNGDANDNSDGTANGSGTSPGSDEENSKSTNPKSDSSSPLDRLLEHHVNDIDNIMSDSLPDYLDHQAPPSLEEVDARVAYALNAHHHFNGQNSIDGSYVHPIPSSSFFVYLDVPLHAHNPIVIPYSSSIPAIVGAYHPPIHHGFVLSPSDPQSQCPHAPLSSTISHQTDVASPMQLTTITIGDEIVDPNPVASSSGGSTVTPHSQPINSTEEIDPEDQYLGTDDEWKADKKSSLVPEEQLKLNELMGYLQSIPGHSINQWFAKNLMTMFFDAEYLKALVKQHRKTEVNAVFLATVIRHVIYRRSLPDYEVRPLPELLESFPSFNSPKVNGDELTYLRRFERALRCALHLIPGDRNKQLLLLVGAHLEGSNRTYITGGAASYTTRRRTEIYQKLTNVEPIPRPKRKVNQSTTS